MQYRIVDHRLDKVDSTQSWAKQNLQKMEPGTLYSIRADVQTGGYGRRGGRWFSPKDNLYLTLAWEFPNEREDLQNLTGLFAEVAKEWLQGLGFNVTIKLPNDLMIEGKKLAGILCEVQDGRRIYLGFGLNVNMEKSAGAKIDQPITSLQIASEQKHSVEVLCMEITKKWKEKLEGLR